MTLEDVETVKELKIKTEENENKIQDAGEFKKYASEKITIDQIPEIGNVAESSSYCQKMVFEVGDTKIIVKTKD